MRQEELLKSALAAIMKSGTSFPFTPEEYGLEVSKKKTLLHATRVSTFNRQTSIGDEVAILGHHFGTKGYSWQEIKCQPERCFTKKLVVAAFTKVVFSFIRNNTESLEDYFCVLAEETSQGVFEIVTTTPLDEKPVLLVPLEILVDYAKTITIVEGMGCPEPIKPAEPTEINPND